VQEIELAEVLDDLLLDRALEGEVELLEGLAGGEACCADPGHPAVSPIPQNDTPNPIKSLLRPKRRFQA